MSTYAALEPVLVAVIIAGATWYALRGMARWLPAPLARVVGGSAAACAPTACAGCGSGCGKPAAPATQAAQPLQFVRPKVRPQQFATDSRETLIKE